MRKITQKNHEKMKIFAFTAINGAFVVPNLVYFVRKFSEFLEGEHSRTRNAQYYYTVTIDYQDQIYLMC